MNENLIYDIGMCDGEDTAYYLYKGFKVVGIEPSPTRVSEINLRFREDLIAERLFYIHAAIGDNYRIEQFFTVPRASGLDRLYQEIPASEFVVPTYTAVIPLSAVLEKFGTPYYFKIDIEGNEAKILAQLKGKELPKYISSESHSAEPIHSMYELGYRNFKLALHNTTKGPICNDEPNWKFKYLSSGPLSEDYPGEWVDFNTILIQRENVYKDNSCWADVHAKLD